MSETAIAENSLQTEQPTISIDVDRKTPLATLLRNANIGLNIDSSWLDREEKTESSFPEKPTIVEVDLGIGKVGVNWPSEEDRQGGDIREAIAVVPHLNQLEGLREIDIPGFIVGKNRTACLERDGDRWTLSSRLTADTPNDAIKQYYGVLTVNKSPAK